MESGYSKSQTYVHFPSSSTKLIPFHNMCACQLMKDVRDILADHLASTLSSRRAHEPGNSCIRYPSCRLTPDDPEFSSISHRFRLIERDARLRRVCLPSCDRINLIASAYLSEGSLPLDFRGCLAVEPNPIVYKVYGCIFIYL